MAGTTAPPAPVLTNEDQAAQAVKGLVAATVAGLSGEEFRSFNSKFTSGPRKGEVKPEDQRNKGFYEVLTLKRGEAIAAGVPAELLPPYSKVKVAVTVTIVAPDPDDA